MSPADARLVEARARLARHDEAGARALLDAVAVEPVSPAWADALIELVMLDHAHADYERMAERAGRVVAAAGIAERLRAEAACWGALAADYLDRPVDLVQLGWAIDVLAADEPYLAAVALGIRAGRTPDEETAAAEQDWRAAIALYERAGSMLGPASARYALARLALGRGDVRGARDLLAAGLAWLVRFPTGGANVRHLERKLRALVAKLP